jgi:steroid 5-alpha reductase family enzyme
MMFWIVRFATGVPPLERAMLASKGEAYRRYQARVSTLLPRPPHAAPKPAAPVSPYGA